MSTKVYIAKRNSDQTEGRGSMIAIGYFLNDPEAAIKAVKGQGVMGVGDGDIWVITFNKKGGETLPGVESHYYGYHRNYQGMWVHGLMDDVNPPAEEAAEYEQYLNLKKKFGGK